MSKSIFTKSAVLIFIFLAISFFISSSGYSKDNFFTENIDNGPKFKESFDRGYEKFLSKDYYDASAFLFHYIDSNSRDSENYDWAEFFLGLSLEKLGYSHGSVEVLSYLVKRKPNTRIVNHVLEYFENLTRKAPYDHEKIINMVVIDEDYGFVDKKIKDFIHYHQGVFDWKNGFKKWGDNHFAKISKRSAYYYKYLFQVALYKIVEDKPIAAIETLEKIDSADFHDEKLKNEVRKTLARLYYETGQYKKSDKFYKEITENITTQARNLLERSWTRYRMGDQEKAMGLLYSYKAPVYKDYFTPEYFLLKSLIYKDVCHYKRALSVINEFREHYNEALDGIYQRGEIVQNKEVLLVLLAQKNINRLWHFLLVLEKEKERIKEFKDSNLRSFLEKIYDLEIASISKKFRLAVQKEYEKIANDLLEYEKKADLMEYEIGLDMYKRVYASHYDYENKDKKQKLKKDDFYYAFFFFQNEFWSDELDNYKVVLEDKCTNMEEWDIFFK